MIKEKAFKLFSLVAAISLAVCVLTGAADIPNPTNEFFVNDFANVINDADEREIMQSAVSLYNATKAQVVVVTVDSLEGEEVNTYALNLGEKWGVGEKETDTGVVLLLSVSERKVTIQVGYGLEGAINDAKAGRLLDTYGVPYFKSDDFSTGLKGVQKAIINEVYAEFGLEENIEGNYYGDEEEEEMTIFDVICFVIALAIIIFVLIKNPSLLYFFALSGRGGSSGGFHGGFHGGGGFSGGGFSGGGGSFVGGGSSRGF